MLSIRSVVHTSAAHSRASHVRARASAVAVRVSTRSETVARARELRSPCSTAVAARRRAETGAASVVLQRDSRAFGVVRVVLAGVAMTFVDGLLNGLVVETTVGDCEAADDQEDQDKDDDDDDGRRVLTLRFLVVDVAGVQCEVSR